MVLKAVLTGQSCCSVEFLHRQPEHCRVGQYQNPRLLPNPVETVYQRLNISMACNHCDNPVCLKGCPTRAYTKFAEYGAVLQDPDICFGCGYCTWVCPYNAPQLDTKAGHVSKCNMCVDRLEVGLKPACASACLAGALEFGVIETLPAHREMLDAQIPGFPSPEITHPNIRFQQAKSLPREMRRTDSMPLRYERDDASKTYRPKVAEDGRPR